MTPAVRGALVEWLSGLIVGLIPLFAHGLCYGILDTPAAAGDWSIDLVFIAITTSGLSVVGVFARLIKGTASLSGRTHLIIIMALTVLIVISAAVVYGGVASGHAHNPLTYTIWILISSIVASMYFELAMARRLPPPVAGAPA